MLGALVVWLHAPTAAAQRQEPSVGLQLEQRYDDNVLLKGEHDFVTRITPQLGYRLLSRGGNQLELRYDADIFTYAQGTADTSVGHRALLDGRLAASKRVGLRFIEKFAYAYDPATLDRPAVVQLNGPVLLNQTYLAMDYALARRWALHAEYQTIVARFSNVGSIPGMPTIGLVSGDEHDVQTGVFYRASRTDTVGLSGRAQAFVADGQYAGVSLAPIAGLVKRLTRRVRLEVQAGPLFYVPGNVVGLNNVLPDQMHPQAGHTLVSYLVGATLVAGFRRFTADVRFARDLIGGGGLDAVLWALYGGVELRYQILKPLTVMARGRFYQNGTAPNGPSQLTGIVAEGGIDYMTPIKLSVALLYSHLSQDIPGGDTFALQRNIVGIRLAYRYGFNDRGP
jgi:hypothetical protein